MLRRFFKRLLRAALVLFALFAVTVILDYVTHRVPPGSVLLVTLDGPVVERGRTGMLGLLRGGPQVALEQIRKAVGDAATDPRVAGLAIEVLDPQMELAQAQEIAALAGKFAGRGKWTAAYLESAGEFAPGNLPYLVASAAGEVSMMPQGELNLVGVGTRELFVRDTLDWLGIRPNLDAIGEYKSAGNIFTEKNITVPQREADESLIESLFSQIVGQIARQRRLDPAAVRALIDQAPLSAGAGLTARLVDRLEYEDQFSERIKNRGGEHHALIDYGGYARPPMMPSLTTSDRIAVIYGSGEIQRGRPEFDPLLSPGGSSMGSEPMVEAFEQAREDDRVRAVIFRVNSPGGSVIGSELIRRQVELTARRKPVVVSMSGYAASGGYWVSVPAARIIADPGTITGSIGVLGGKFNIAPAAAKLGVNSAAVTRGANVGMFDEFTDFTPVQQQILRNQMLGDTYKDFLKLVAQGRHLSVEQVDQVARGRVWSGEQALQFKLVDALGDFDVALAEARKAAKLPPERKVEMLALPEQPGLLSRLLSGGFDPGASAASSSVVRALGPWRSLIRAGLARRGAFGELYCPLRPVM